MEHIVVIDDEPLLLKTLERLLTSAGYRVTTASSIHDVDELLVPEGFDVLVSDILLPDMLGTEILRRVKDRGCEEPVVLITGEPDYETASEAVRLGAFDYLAKPVTKKELLGVVDRALRQLRLLRQRDMARRSEMALLRSLAQIGESAAALAHEIRSPITAIHRALEVVADRLDAEAHVIVLDLVASMERVERLMERTLSFARPYLPRLGQCELQHIIENAIEEVRTVQGDPRLKIEVSIQHGLQQLLADQEALQEVLINLVRNAVEAAAPEPHVLIRAQCGKEDTLSIEVHDNGPGIPPSTRASLFEPFTTSKANGTGLGLAVSRRIVEGHGGSIEVGESELGGACFRVLLPERAET